MSQLLRQLWSGTSATRDESNRKPNTIWVDKGSKFYNRSMKSWSQEDHIKIYSAHYEGKPVAAERFTESLKNKIYK